MDGIKVPEPFRVEPPGAPYPPHQVGPQIEAWFHEFHEANRDRFPSGWTYLPVHWTAYYNEHEFGWRPLRKLQQFLDEALDPSLNYFTVVQHDDGILNLLPESVVVFGAGGCGDIPIPLPSTPHPPATGERDLLASYVGMPTHWSRRRLDEILAGDPRFRIGDPAPGAEGIERFEGLMGRSEFALCPRGNGRTSFRLYEAIQMGVPPVYLYDDAWLPWADEINWREFSVLVHLDEMRWLPEILEAISPTQREEMRRALARLAPTHFSFEACGERILDRVQRMAIKGFERPVVGRSVNEALFRASWIDQTRRSLSKRPI